MSTLTSRSFTLFNGRDPAVEERKRSLRYDFNALADFEQANGMGLGQLLQMKAVFGTARALLWAGLKHEDVTLTLEKVGELCGEFVRGGGRVDDIMSTCLETAIDQGALGVRKKGDDSDSGNEPSVVIPAKSPKGLSTGNTGSKKRGQ